ncbi:GNAT family N-acetyltransferase [Demequina activiva]|uniref:Acetyltransferase n=1 Tax=Demequina activiva TaxID=1582364 RepID=A0A919UKU1_9MICO|nr:GNAT family protein [Demequina activiva]GIG55345.1 acetyltransferase [Demequina activiva]
MPFAAAPVLENPWVRLEPLTLAHAPELAGAIAAGDLARIAYTRIPPPDAVDEEIERRLALQREGWMAPWAVVDSASGRAVGMTTYMNIDALHRRVEIGSTWLARQVQGTRVNPAMKLLLLSRAFEDLGCIAVELRTDRRNAQSRAAIEKLGAREDGVLRHHMIMPDGHLRDTVVYSVLAQEWPAVRERLLARLSEPS